MKVLMKRFHLSGHTIGFHPQTQTLELNTKQTASNESTAKAEVLFEWSHLVFLPRTSCRMISYSLESKKVSALSFHTHLESPTL